MKTDLKQTPTQDKRPSGPAYWRSLDEWAEKPEFKEWLHREFPQGASESEGVNRRNFFKIMAASFAVAGLGAAGCRRPESYILPYHKQPEGTIPGNPVFFSTSFPGTKDSLPLVVETHGHRPTHIEGNRAYAPYGGSTSAFASASILNLYDPDRMAASYRGSRRINRERVRDLIDELVDTFGATGGQGLAILAEPSTSPTRARLVRQLKEKFPRMIWAEYSAVDQDNPERATEEVFGARLRPHYKLESAKRILSLDADFVSSEPGSNAMARDFAKGRKVRNQADAGQMSRLYSVEANMTLTGSMADHRLRLSSSQITAFTAMLAAKVIEATGGDTGLARFLRDRASGLSIDLQWIDACVEDLLEHRGQSLVIAGSHLPKEAHVLSIFINRLLGAEGETVRYLELPESSATSIAELASSIESGRVESLLVLGGNPVYNAPADLQWKRLQKQVPQVIRYGYYFDETSIDADYSIAATHYLESWSDGRTFEGVYVPVQPMILPLFEGFQEIEILSRLADADRHDAYDHVLETFRAEFDGNESGFKKLLSEGFLAGSGYTERSVDVAASRVRNLLSRSQLTAPELSANALELRLVPDSHSGDGSFNNNGWMQECPDPVTKLTWDNAILISPALAKHLGFDTKSGDFLIGGIAKTSSNFKRGSEISRVAELTIDGVTLSGPIQIQPGLADWTVVVSLGYGRRNVGRVGKGTGFDVYPLTKSEARAIRTGARLSLTNREFKLANTQAHWSVEGRAILREGSASQHLQDSEWAQKMGMESHSPPIYGTDKDMPLHEKVLKTPRGGSAFDHPDFADPAPNVKVWNDPENRKKFIPDQQWGMSIDLNTCIGCNACVVACQSENNIPIVGKEQIMRGREMHWIRLDRYYSSGDVEANRGEIPSDPQVSLMPVGCLHCERAPCEQVCPVNATVHDSQGLNVMAYNRCVGTRYCANNCPYKVRRFNFFDYNKRSADEFYKGPLGENLYKTEGGQLVSMQRNPDVTVRMRGVMEKCTYCVQRIQQARIAQKVKAKDSNDIHIPDGVLRVACQTACPTEAIVFGDVSDPDSAVSRSKDNDRDYALLGYLNTRPRTTYLARVRNPNPQMPDYERIRYPHTQREYKSVQPQPVNGGHSAHH